VLLRARVGCIREELLAGTQHAQKSAEHTDATSYQLEWLMDTRQLCIKWREDRLLFLHDLGFSRWIFHVKSVLP